MTQHSSKRFTLSSLPLLLVSMLCLSGCAFQGVKVWYKDGTQKNFSDATVEQFCRLKKDPNVRHIEYWRNKKPIMTDGDRNQGGGKWID